MILNRPFYLISTTLLLLFLSACSYFQDCTKGSGEVIEKELKLDNFEEITVNGSYDVFLRQGETQKVSVKAQSNLVELINSSVSGKSWEIAFDPCIETNELVEIYIQIPKLSALSVLGSGNVKGENPFNTNKLELQLKGSGSIDMNLETKELSSEIQGSGDFKLSGSTKKHQIEINGSGDLNAFELSSAETDIEINGSGDVKVNVSYALNAEVNGSGDIYYKGSVKQINSSIDGSGKLNQAD